MYVFSGWTTLAGTGRVVSLAIDYPDCSPCLVSNPRDPGRNCVSCLPRPALLTDWRYPAVPPGFGGNPDSLAGYKAAMLYALASWYTAQIAGGFTYNSVVYPLDAESRQDWLEILTLVSSFTFPINIVSQDGNTVTSADQVTATAIANASFTARHTIKQNAASYRSRIIAAATVAALDAITIGS